MALKNVKVTISRLGVHTMEGNTTVYMPLANIEYMELGEKKKTVHLDGKMVSDKKYFKGWILGSSYFVGVTADPYQIYDEDGNRTGTSSIEEFGEPIQANEDDFICLKGRIASLIGINGKCKKSRALTNEKYESITKE